MNKDELTEILKEHKKYLELDGGGRANLQYANLQDADLRNADLQGADLEGADLQYANLQDADLRNADLQGADLEDANLMNADLQGADLQDANLMNANLRYADLQDANLQDANLQGANLSETTGVRYSQVSFASHGECGRQLLAVEVGGEVVCFCGCFRGSFSDLQKYIDSGESAHRESRQKALNFVKFCF